MIKEKHLCNKTYGNHQLARYIDVYEVTTDGCSSSPMSGYKGTEATLIDQPAWNEKFSSYSITGATLTGNNFILNNDVTAKANYETAKNLTLQTDGHGSIAANKMSGFIGDQVTLSNTANSNYGFSGYTITGATLTGNKFNFTGSNVTAKAWFSGYTAINFGNSPLVFQATNTNSGEIMGDGIYYLTATNITQTKSINVTYDLISRTYNGRDVNLTYTANLFPYSGYTDWGSLSAINSVKNYISEYSTAQGENYDILTVGHLKLGNNESAVVTAVFIDLTGNVGNYAAYNLPNAGFKITLNNMGLPTIATQGDGLGHAHIHSDGKVVLQNPIVLTNTYPYLTFNVTGLMPAQVASFTNVQMWDSHWYGYIRGADI